MTNKEKPHDFVSDAFFYSFFGEHIECIGSFKHEDEEIGLKVEGILLDADDTWYFLGDTDEEIVCCIRQNDVTSIRFVTENNEYQNILQDMGSPTDSEEIN